MPTTGRIQRQILEKRKKVLSKVLSITLILFRLANAGDAKATVNVTGYEGKEGEKRAVRNERVRADAKQQRIGREGLEEI